MLERWERNRVARAPRDRRGAPVAGTATVFLFATEGEATGVGIRP